MVVGGLAVAGGAAALGAVVGALVVSGGAVVLAAVVSALVVANAAVVLATVVGGLVVASAAVVGLAAGVLVDRGAAVVEDQAAVAAVEVARVLDEAAGPMITEIVEGPAGTATPGTVPRVRVTDLEWKLTTAARPATVAPTKIGARLTEFAPGTQPSA
jgi:hypothetical protein